jgi:hypothetical protein
MESNAAKKQFDIIGDTVMFWQTKTGVNVSEEEARAIIENIAGFFELLHEWDSKEAEGTSMEKKKDCHLSLVTDRLNSDQTKMKSEGR